VVERIKKALELARQERGSAAAVRVPYEQSGLAQGERGVADAAEAEPAVAARLIAPRQEALIQGRLLLPGLVGDASHGFRILRTQVLQRMRQRGWNTLAVLSATPDEGKTFTAINLAIAIAATAETNALLVDLDLRFPRLYRRFDFLPTVGIEDCLRGEVSIADAIVSVEGYPGMTLLPARGPVDHSSELIGSPGARAVFRELKERYANRIVIYDLPPLLATDDALTFVPQVDAVLVVVGDGNTRRADLMRTMELLRDTPILGTVLNGSHSDRSAAYAY
jgi:Mrp family chromosome partitioning ATPase